MAIENPNPTDFTTALSQQQFSLLKLQQLSVPRMIEEITDSPFPNLLDYDQDQIEFGTRFANYIGTESLGRWSFSLAYPRRVKDQLYDGSLRVIGQKRIPHKREMYSITDNMEVILIPQGELQISGKEVTLESSLSVLFEDSRPLRTSLEKAFKKPLRRRGKIVMVSLGTKSRIAAVSSAVVLD